MPVLLLLAALAGASEPEAPCDPDPEPDEPETTAAARFLNPDHVLGSGPDTLSLHAWGRGGYAAEWGPDGVVDHGPYLAMARLKARFDHEDRYGVYLHLAADRGALALADAEVHASVAEDLRVTVGRMKVPVSHDFLVPVEQMLLPTRALLDRLAPSRAVGLQAQWTPHLKDARLHPRVRGGVFSPLDPSFQGLPGAQVVLQGDLHRDEGIFVHGAGAVWLKDKELERFGEATSPWDLRADLAVGFENQAWTLHLEGLMARRVVVGEPDGEGSLDGGATAMAGHRIEVAHKRHLVLEPVVALDLRHMGEEPMVRGTAAVNLHEDGWHLLQTLAWEVERTPSEGVGHRVLLQLQAGL